MGHQVIGLKKYFHKIDKATKTYLVYKRKAMGVLLMFVGLLWAMEMAGWFNTLPFHGYFVPAVLVVAGLFEIVRAYSLE